jgi:nitrite reductase/ring-hydroxylating ferredoxin subunit
VKKPETKIAVGSVDSFAEGKFEVMTIAGREIGIVKLRTGEFRAVLNYCPHKGAKICRGIVGGTWPPALADDLRFEREGEILVCPWHGFEYDLVTGHELFWNRPTRLRFYPTSVEDGQLMVSISGAAE